jgi:hypothetical protein
MSQVVSNAAARHEGHRSGLGDVDSGHWAMRPAADQGAGGFAEAVPFLLPNVRRALLHQSLKTLALFFCMVLYGTASAAVLSKASAGSSVTKEDDEDNR